MEQPLLDQPAEGARREPLEELAENFVERLRRGECPPIGEYEAAHPELALEIRAIFPTLLMMERCAPEDTVAGFEVPISAEGVPRLGDYRIIREIGRGGMGVVYEAEQESLGRHVALKVLPAHSFLDERKRARFLFEARSAARLHHSNIVPVFGIGEEQGLHYYAMQHIRGHSLDLVLREVMRLRDLESPRAAAPASASSPSEVADALISGSWAQGSTDSERSEAGPDLDARARRSDRFSRSAGSDLLGDGTGTSSEIDGRFSYFRSVARVGLQVAYALSYAHGEGVLHRDIKPSNLLLDHRGEVWITDFGLAKPSEGHDLTGTGDVVGTLRYLAPERFEGQADARTDVYSLGATIYELLALKPAFPGERREVLVNQVLRTEPTALRRIDPLIPRDLETIVQVAMSKEPSRRYASAGALAEDLRRFLDVRPINARRASLVERLFRWCQRNPALACCLAVILLLLVVIASVSVAAAIDLREERNVAQRAERETRLRLGEARLREARAARRSREPGQRLRSLEALSEAKTSAPPLEVRNELIAAWALTDVEMVDSWDDHRHFDPERIRYARIERDGRIKLFECEGDVAVLSLKDEGGIPERVEFSPDGALIAAKVRGEASYCIVVWNLADGRAILRTEVGAHGLPFAFRGDGRMLAVAGRHKGVRLFSIPDVREVLEIQTSVTQSLLGFSPDGQKLAIAAREISASVELWDLRTVTHTERLIHTAAVSDLAWHPRGEHVVCTTFDGKVHIWDAGRGRRLAMLGGHVTEAVRVRMSEDGELIGTYGWDGRTRIWSFLGQCELISFDGLIQSFAKDGRSLIVDSASGGALMRLARSDVYQELGVDQRSKGPWQLAFSPDGAWLAAGSGEEGALIWSIGDLGRATRLPSGRTLSVDFEPNGSAVLTASPRGLMRWPLQGLSESGTPMIGPAEVLGMPSESLAQSADGGVVAHVGPWGGFVRSASDGSGSVSLGSHPGAVYVSVSPDGRTIATGAWRGREIKIWDSATGELQHAFDTETAVPAFSPDGQWLTINTPDSYRFHRASDWKESFRLARPGRIGVANAIAFSADGRIAGIIRDRHRIELLEMPSGRSLALLDPPHATFDIVQIAISKDGSRLAAASVNQRIQLWNILGLRKLLRDFDLDWWPDETLSEAEPSLSATPMLLHPGARAPPAPTEVPLPASDALAERLDHLEHRMMQGPGPRRIALIERARLFEAQQLHADMLSDVEAALVIASTPDALLLRGKALEALGRWEDAGRSYEDVLAMAPHHPEGLARRANHVLDYGRGDAKGALELIGQIADRYPDDIEMLRAQGLALCYIGRHRESAAILTRVHESLPDDPHTLLHLALCLQELGEVDQAGPFAIKAHAAASVARLAPRERQAFQELAARFEQHRRGL